MTYPKIVQWFFNIKVVLSAKYEGCLVKGSVSPLCGEDGELVTDLHEIAELRNNYFVEVCDSERYNNGSGTK